MYRGTIFFGLLLCLGLFSCKREAAFENGLWRGVFTTEAGIEIPFQFEVYDSAGVKQVAFINGSERLNISDVTLKEDSVTISTPLYATSIKAKLQAEGLQGTWTRELPGRMQEMKFAAKPNITWRFSEQADTTDLQITGRWSVLMKKGEPVDTTIAVGQFTQEGNKLAGAFLTNTGDSRFLYGEINAGKLYLSSYSGSAPSLFTATIKDDSTLVDGKSYSGPSASSTWEASKDDHAELADPYTLTKLKEGKETLSFVFPDLEGNQVSIQDDRFKGKVVVVQFLGSWCPNCMDETAFLSPFYDRYKSKGVEVVGLAYERYAEQAKAKKAVLNLVERFKINYPILLTGHTPANALESIPELQSFNAFPTTIILDKQGKVASIHTGFSGPATGDAYTSFIESFERRINNLLTEQSSVSESNALTE